MADKTGIEWTDATWNPIVGCSIVSPACTNCYAMAQAARIEAMHAGRHAPHIGPNSGPAPATHYAGTTEASKAGPVWTGKVALAPDDVLTRPLRWKRPRRIFVNSMGDLFHESVPDEWIDRVFAVMALAPQHTFQILTKRAKRMREYLLNPWTRVNIGDCVGNISADGDNDQDAFIQGPWPLPTVWPGVTAEDQARADERIPDLLATPAAKRFVSCEPMLGQINLKRIRVTPHHHTIIDALDGYAITDKISGSGQERARLDWVIAGGESGPKARPSHPDWFRSLRDQCAAAGVPFFFKQWGEWSPHYGDRSKDRLAVCKYGSAPFEIKANEQARQIDLLDRCQMIRVGKRRAGFLLDGREHKEFPA